MENKPMSFEGGIDMYSMKPIGLKEVKRVNDKQCAGRKVIFTAIGGYDHEIDYALSLFERNQELIIEEIEVGRSSSKVKLEGYDDWFNTCMFQDEPIKTVECNNQYCNWMYLGYCSHESLEEEMENLKPNYMGCPASLRSDYEEEFSNAYHRCSRKIRRISFEKLREIEKMIDEVI